MLKIEGDWKDLLADELGKDYYKELMKFLLKEYSEAVVYPSKEDVFSAFNQVPYEDIKVVIVRTRSIYKRERSSWYGLFCAAGDENTTIT